MKNEWLAFFSASPFGLFLGFITGILLLKSVEMKHGEKTQLVGFICSSIGDVFFLAKNNLIQENTTQVIAGKPWRKTETALWTLHGKKVWLKRSEEVFEKRIEQHESLQEFKSRLPDTHSAFQYLFEHPIMDHIHADQRLKRIQTKIRRSNQSLLEGLFRILVPESLIANSIPIRWKYARKTIDRALENRAYYDKRRPITYKGKNLNSVKGWNYISGILEGKKPRSIPHRTLLLKLTEVAALRLDYLTFCWFLRNARTINPKFSARLTPHDLIKNMVEQKGFGIHYPCRTLFELDFRFLLLKLYLKEFI